MSHVEDNEGGETTTAEGAGKRRSTIRQLFALIDEKCVGSVTKEEATPLLISIFGEKEGNAFWSEMIKECDANGDGKIDEDEFADYYLTHVCKNMDRDQQATHLLSELERYQTKLMYRFGMM
uniref:EF-hand domain-containing protein n=1 Tax=Haptolina ericina TaxID=156174 RepID=A0A7S3FM69_9EUKA|mmetsp:Transcript_73619/g.163635  ORF Transcript_73619/g.163635 Transcript_73619/m.163635 type:complete len:122 (+) Transcript_73619:20-385(+)|eukprot:CAMPEP_0181223786 /NCGR_PEP_ID=MMETSP1096-20121128/30744_1 /TAXON_ID=156174 ORGANISM="Chrysochromulina ericina, Strain CCMP281" /NCGR_SAMPLE_ID=MMETSP1096 /ASSEMBLY_ACC=CAM_ASM_000453 /LENGTH=121 /DNA_ID=CAMNT_0023316755 /DNA_START=20 /DNA_END=385 /DNA_ORIENTATION=-